MSDPQHFRSLFNRKSAEELELDNPALLRIHLRELIRPHSAPANQFQAAFTSFSGARDRKTLLVRATALYGLMLARVVNENSPHQLRRNSEKMGAILPFGVSLIDQL